MDKKYLTLVFRNISQEEVNRLISHDNCVFMSWSHVPNEKTELVKELADMKDLLKSK